MNTPRAWLRRLKISLNHGTVRSVKPALKVLSLSLALALAGTASLKAAASLGVTRIEGRDYVKLTDWARVNNFQVQWLKRDETIQLKHNSAKATVTVDSREAQVDGVQVWLSFPPIGRAGVLYLSQLDAQAALQPLLLSGQSDPSRPLRSICLDPGHGGKDPGYCVGREQEKKYTLLLAKELRDQLARVGFKVNLTRTGDKFVELTQRPALAKQRNSDLFVSLHFNAAETGQNSVQGTQVFCVTPPGAASTNTRGEGGETGWAEGNRHNRENTLLAFQVQKVLTRRLGVEDRGVRRARFVVLREAAVPAVLIEAGFMSHPVEGHKILLPEYRRQLAQAIVEGLLAYERIRTGRA